MARRRGRSLVGVGGQDHGLGRGGYDDGVMLQHQGAEARPRRVGRPCPAAGPPVVGDPVGAGDPVAAGPPGVGLPVVDGEAGSPELAEAVAVAIIDPDGAGGDDDLGAAIGGEDPDQRIGWSGWVVANAASGG